MNKIERNRIKNNIINKLEEILEQVENLSHYPNKIPQIDIDIVMGNVRTLYEQFYALNKTNSRLLPDDESNIIISKPEEAPKTKEVPFQQPEITPEMEALEVELLETSLPEPEEEVAVEEQVISEPLKSEIEIPVENIAEPLIEMEKIAKEPEAEIIPETKVLKPQTLESLFDIEPKAKETKELKENKTPDLFAQSSQTTIAGKYKNETISINDRLQKNKQDKSIGLRMQKNPIKDLKTAIGINEKFLFINELFKGNMKDYTDTILRLNDMTHLEDAKDILDGLFQKYNWDPTSLPYQTFMSYIERKLV
jgi:hypothetical protein